MLNWARKLLRFPHKPKGGATVMLETADTTEARLRKREAEAEERKRYKELLKREAIPLIRSHRR